jgi:heat shock protein HslJ
MSPRPLITTLAFLSAAILANPAFAADGVKKASLSNTTWRVETINGAAPAGASPPTITFGPAYRLSGSTGCNPFYGIYGTDNDYVAIRTAVAAACDTSPDQKAFLGILSQTPKLELRSDGALAIEGKGGAMVLVRGNNSGT